MFHVMWNSDYSETRMLNTLKEAIQQRLPKGWIVSVIEEDRRWNRRTDATLEIKSPDGITANASVEIKQRPLEARDIITQFRWLSNSWLNQSKESTINENNFILIAPYLGKFARAELTKERISYADMTGNIRLALRQPAVFIEAQGATKNPFRENVPLKSLRGRSAGRVVRGILDYQPPFGTRELSDITKTPVATVSRVFDLLDREAIVNRDSPRGRILSVNWEQLLRRWTQDYNFTKSNQMSTYLEPRGTQETLRNLLKSDFEYAITGSFAAIKYAPIAQSKLLTIYTTEPEIAEKELGLRRAETGGNIVLGKPFGSVVFEHMVSLDGLKYVSVGQVAADLLTGPGRSPSEGEALIDWMKMNEEKWRIPLIQPM